MPVCPYKGVDRIRILSIMSVNASMGLLGLEAVVWRLVESMSISLIVDVSADKAMPK